jgi:RNA recognition motif-containing protein
MAQGNFVRGNSNCHRRRERPVHGELHYTFEERDSMKIYVGNLPYSATEEDLRSAFAAYGEVSEVNLITDRFSGDSKGFAFVEMTDNASADAAIKGLNETNLGGRNIKVNQAKPRPKRQTRDSRW